MTEQPIRSLRLQGIARDWSKHNEHSRNIFSVHGFLRLSVKRPQPVSLFVVHTSQSLSLIWLSN